MYLGEISFAVYILHYPVLQLLRVLLRPELLEVATKGSDTVVFATFFGALAVVILVAAIAHAYIEVPARNWARRCMDGEVSPSPLRREPVLE